MLHKICQLFYKYIFFGKAVKALTALLRSHQNNGAYFKYHRNTMMSNETFFWNTDGSIQNDGASQQTAFSKNLLRIFFDLSQRATIKTTNENI